MYIYIYTLGYIFWAQWEYNRSPKTSGVAKYATEQRSLFGSSAGIVRPHSRPGPKPQNFPCVGPKQPNGQQLYCLVSALLGSPARTEILVVFHKYNQQQFRLASSLGDLDRCWRPFHQRLTRFHHSGAAKLLRVNTALRMGHAAACKDFQTVKYMHIYIYTHIEQLTVVSIDNKTSTQRRDSIRMHRPHTELLIEWPALKQICNVRMPCMLPCTSSPGKHRVLAGAGELTSS